MILPCTCKHDYQDREHGRNMRVHNPCNYGYRCSVCGHETRAGVNNPNEEKKEDE